MSAHTNIRTSQAQSEAAALKPGTLLARARALQGALRARADDANKRRDIPKETIADFHQAELFKVLRSTRYGGFEGDPRLFFDIQNALAEACPSSAWVYGVLSVQYLLLAGFDAKAQDEVFGQNPETLVSSSFVPKGQAQAEGDGYRLTGRWPFSSGSSHANWVLVGGIVPANEPGAQPDRRLFLLPRSNYRITENWDTFGLSATGSNDIVIENAFVPAYRSIGQTMGMLPLPDDGTKSTLHRLPWLYIFTASVGNLAIGITRGAARIFLDDMQTRTSAITGKALKDDPAVQIAATRALAEADSAEAVLRQHVADMLDVVTTGKPTTIQDALLARVQLTSTLIRLAPFVDAMQTLVSGRGIHNNGPLTRMWLDMMAARQHPGNNPSMSEGGYSSFLFKKA